MVYISILVYTLAARQASPTSLSQALCGSWVGTLEYRDYSDNSRQKLGTLLRIWKSGPDDKLTFRYVYDDGPHKVVQDQELVNIDAGASTYSIDAGDGKPADRYTVSGLDRLSKGGTGTIVLIGKGTENDVTVDIRQTLSVSPKSLSVVRESRIKGQEFLFRHAYRFNRVD